MRKRRIGAIGRMICAWMTIGTTSFFITGCSFFGGSATETNEIAQTSVTETVEINKISSLELDHTIPMEKAEYLNIDAYKDGYYVITAHKDQAMQQMLIVPEGKNVPENIDDNIIVVQQPVTSSKIDSISLLTLLGDINSELLGKVSVLSYNKDNIFTEKIVNNISEGITKYVGSEKAPDLNLIKDAGIQVYLCNPALVKESAYEEIKKLGITPFVAYIHQEHDPLGRIEWGKALGAIYGDLDSANSFFANQKAAAESADWSNVQDKTYVMFYLQKDKNKAYVRRKEDTVAKIGELAGGKNSVVETGKSSWAEMSIEDFVNSFKDTDFLIYFDKHGDNINTLDELKGISETISDMKAIQNNDVWRTRTDYIQMSNIGDMIKELNWIFTGDIDAAKKTVEFVKIQ